MNEEEALTLIYTMLEKSGTAEVKFSAVELERSSEELLPIWKKQTESAPIPGKVGALLPFNYVIPDQDLKLVETVFSVMTTASGVGFLLPSLGYDPQKGVAAAVTGVIVAILKLYRNLKLSVRLDDTDYGIVALLSHAQNKGISVQEITDKLKMCFPAIRTDSVSKRLNGLTACSTLSGTKTALTWKDASERWHVNGV
jgi:hypothetical protein